MVKEFSLQSNIEKLVNIPVKRDTLSSIFGLRVLCMISILVYHTFNTFPKAAFGEPNELRNKYIDFTHKIYIILRQCVGIFFIISGFLLSYTTLPELHQKKSNYNWKQFILRRLLRLTPVYYFTLIIYVFLIRYLGGGPQWPLQELRSHEGCTDYWWSNFFYLQDIIPYSILPCMHWSWYVSCDLQFFMISPFILYSYYRNKLYGYICCAALIFVNFLYIGTLSQYYEFTPRYYQGMTDEFQGSLLATKPLAWVCAFIIGIVIGFLYRTHLGRIATPSMEINLSDETEIQHNTSYSDRFELFCLKIVEIKCIRYGCYILGVIMMLASEFYQYELDKYGNDYWSQSFKSFYLANQHFMYGIGFAFWFLPILLGHCGVVRKILSLGIFFPLARLTFAAYLVHPMVLEIFIFSNSQRIIVGDFTLVIFAISTLVITLLISAVIVLTVELPMLSLEKKILHH